ncbi:hypothetical protein AIOL_002001 [Candidatus Rhodobacter oscarellae]|uniref:LCCL domain-containing protein n=1 Tax=Candidatus Rhodobacter oscarellae TaxID=1675527 RepID=A0A0J9GU13_9RHOB|nr:LCCL domain-containing protein [Candidatus Rhodobacter lobularis]KMW57043.1 hypothetical protein AIOL_002001 [Candidatus Rhodobacter lobularis]
MRYLITPALLIFGTVLAAPAIAQSGKKSPSGAAPVEAPECGRFPGGDVVCSCPAGGVDRSVWGVGPYTGDSDVCTAARHAGVIGADGGVVSLSERPGQSGYEGSTANGVTTSSWGSYGQSFAFASAGGASTLEATGLPRCTKMPAGADRYSCACPADAPLGSVWGNGPYTADSDICTAALHLAYIDAEGGDVHVLRVQGLSSYFGAESNGVTSSGWGAFVSSTTFHWNR